MLWFNLPRKPGFCNPDIANKCGFEKNQPWHAPVNIRCPVEGCTLLGTCTVKLVLQARPPQVRLLLDICVVVERKV